MNGKLNFEALSALMKADRSVRRFDAAREVKTEELQKMVELVRYCASGRNAQPLKYKIVTGSDVCDALFPLLKWAGYYTDWNGPAESERPTAYIVQCLDKDISATPMADEGLQLQAITLGATAMGMGCCIIKSFDVPALCELLMLPGQLAPLHVLAVGYPAEKVEIVDIQGNDYKYYRGENDEQCVPKRRLKELLID